ncbi:MAG: SGNH/GDSL hydrolase family protein [SAR324 cluster bacterium]|nr:SGNH/GDSL hydrolase family protein [SAR324 cluster bacterium]
MRKDPTWNPSLLGVSFIGLAFGFNRYTVPYLFFFPPPLESSILLNLVGGIEIVFLVTGLGILCWRPVIRKPSGGEILLLGGSIFLSLSAAEITAQFWMRHYASTEQLEKYGAYDQFLSHKVALRPHHYLNYDLNPSHKDHNSLGFRGEEFPKEKEEGEFRIVTIGGSTTYSSRVSDNSHTYPAQIERLLKNQYRCQKIRVINAGVKGYTSFENLINLMFRVLDLNPDLVIVYQATNDVHARLVDPAAYRGDNSGYRKQWSVPPQSIWDNLVLIRILRRKLGISYPFSIQNFVGASTRQTELQLSQLLEENPPIYFERNLKSMVALSHIHDFQLMLATWAHSPHLKDYAANPDYQRGFQEHNTITQAIAKKYQLPFLNFAELMPQESQYWHDGRHVNDKGALFKARIFVKFIIEQKLVSPSNRCRYTDQ